MALRRVKSTKRGFALRLPGPERDVLRTLPGQLRALLEGADRADAAIRRLYPSAYLDDEEASEEFDGIVREDLTAQRARSMEVFERTIDATTLTEDEIHAWLSVVNDVRLVLGVRLGVTEESVPEDYSRDEETESSYALYAYLSFLEEEIVDALSAGMAAGTAASS